MTDETRFCTLCGSANKASATHCDHCGRDMHKKNSPFRDFLSDHVKESLGDKAKEGIFSLLQNFLRSHLYGVILSLSILAVGTVFAATQEPNIPKVSSPASAVEIMEAEARKEPEDMDKFSEEYLRLDEESFQLYLDYVCRIGSEFRGTQGPPGPEFSQVLADEALPDFPYVGVHEARSVFGSSRWEGVKHYITIPSEHFDTDRKHFQSDLAKQLDEDGYEVFERTCYIIGYNEVIEEFTDDAFDPENLPIEPDQKQVYRLVFVEVDGRYYIAEDRLIEGR